jgi:hypothetical protein
MVAGGGDVYPRGRWGRRPGAEKGEDRQAARDPAAPAPEAEEAAGNGSGTATGGSSR